MRPHRYEQALDEYLAYALEYEDIRAAKAPAKKAVAVNPWSSLFHERLAYVSLELKDWDGALDEARSALRINPFLRFPRMFVVQCLLHQKNLVLAQGRIRDLDQASSDLSRLPDQVVRRLAPHLQDSVTRESVRDKPPKSRPGLRAVTGVALNRQVCRRRGK